MRPTFLFSPQASPVSFYLLSFLFAVNDHTVRNARFRQWLWDLIKCEIFYVGGACKHSGNCCRTLMIYQKGQPLDTLSKFKIALAKNPVYQRFVPVPKRGVVNHYQCTCLTKDNRCSAYDSRPSFCRNYPLSSFIQEEKVLAGCGFRLARKDFRPWIRSKALLALVEGVLEKNGLV